MTTFMNSLPLLKLVLSSALLACGMTAHAQSEPDQGADLAKQPKSIFNPMAL